MHVHVNEIYEVLVVMILFHAVNLFNFLQILKCVAMFYCVWLCFTCAFTSAGRFLSFYRASSCKSDDLNISW